MEHPHIAHRKHTGAPTHKQAAGTGLNSWLALRITAFVGSMRCAYLFALIALVSLPAILTQSGVAKAGFFPPWSINVGLIAIVAWVAQTLLQLVLLSIIIVGGNVSAAASDARAQATFDDASAVLHTALQIEEHLAAQDALLASIMARP